MAEPLDPVGRFTSRRTLAAVRDLLEDGEELLAAVDGRLDAKPGLLAASDRRVVWAPETGKVRTWGYDEVDAVDVEVGRADATVVLRAGTEETLEGADRNAARAFADAVRQAAPDRAFRRVVLVSDPRHVSPDAKPVFRRRMEQLEAQLARGSLTDAEFRANRRRLMEEHGLPTDLDLGMPRRGPVLPPEPKRAPPAWPKPQGRPDRPMMGEPDWPGRDAPRGPTSSPEAKQWPDERKAAAAPAAGVGSGSMAVRKQEPPAWRPEPKREAPKAPREWPDHKV